MTLNECGNHRHIIVTLRPYLPINEKPFIFDIYPEDNEFVNQICVRGKIPNHQDGHCRTQLNTSNSFYKPLHIKLLASCKEYLQKINAPHVATFSFHKRFFGESNIFWSQYEFPTITVCWLCDYIYLLLYLIFYSNQSIARRAII